jgi:tetratricopeptide (TPR) repeat protein
MQNKYSKAIEYYQQALGISRELGDRVTEITSCWEIGLTYYNMGDLARAEKYITIAVQIAEQIGHHEVETWCYALARVREMRQGTEKT